MKTKEDQIKAKLKTFRRTLKLQVVEHRNLPNAVNSFMIYSGTENSPTAFIVGGNLEAYIPAEQMTKSCYPTVYKSRGAAKRAIDINIWAGHCIENRVDFYEAELRAK